MTVLRFNPICFDNGGQTLDRYTIMFDHPDFRNGDQYQCLALSDNPTHPQGYSQWGYAQNSLGLGYRVLWTDLPEHIRQHVIDRLTETA